VPIWTETACRFPPKPPAGLNRNRLSETPKFADIYLATKRITEYLHQRGFDRNGANMPVVGFLEFS
jgi:hypothetical protein